MSAPYRVLTNIDLLRYINEYHCDIKLCVKHGRNRRLESELYGPEISDQLLVSTMYVAAAAGNLAALQIISTRDNIAMPFSVCDWRNVADNAAMHGHLDIIKWMCTYGSGDSNTCLSYNLPYVATVASVAAKNGHLHIVQWAIETFGPDDFGIDSSTISYVVENGHLHILEWLHANNLFYCFPDIVHIAAEKGHLHILKWLWSNVSHVNFQKDIINSAAYGGSLETVIWLHENGIDTITQYTIKRAIVGGNLDTVKWLHTMNPAIDIPLYPVNPALEKGHLDVVKWVYRKHGIDSLHTGTMSDRLLEVIACKGHLDVFKWMNYDIVKKSRQTLNMIVTGAIVNGKKDLVIWLCERHKLDNRDIYTAMLQATEAGHYDIFKWLSQKYKGRYGHAILEQAAKFGNLRIFQWLCKHGGITINKPKSCIIAAAIIGGNVDIAKQLAAIYGIEVFMPYKHLISNAINKGNLDMVKWMQATIYENDALSLKKYIEIGGALKNNYIYLVKWAVQNGYSNLTDLTEITNYEISDAAGDGFVMPFRWMFHAGFNFTAHVVNIILDMSIEYRNIHILKWLYLTMPEKFLEQIDFVIEESIAHDSLSIIRWIYSICSDSNRKKCIEKIQAESAPGGEIWVWMSTRCLD